MQRRELLALAMSVGLSLTAGEVLVRLLLPRPGFRAFPAADYGVLAPDSLRGYAYAPNQRRRITTPDYDVDFATNALGMRDGPIDSGPPPRTRILAVGDSYTQGLGVAASDAWPERLEGRVVGSRVYNTGVSGYSLQQMRQTAERFVPLIRPHLIVVGLYGHGYYRINDPFVIVPGGASPITRSMASRVRVVADGVLIPEFEIAAARDLTFWLDRHWYLGAHVLHALARLRRAAPVPEATLDRDAVRRAMQPLLDELLRFQREADSLSLPLATMLINPQAADAEFAPEQRMYNEIIAAFAAEHRICVVDPLPALAAAASGRPVLRFRRDVHWTPRAHDLAAEILLRELRAAAGTHAPCGRAGAVLGGKQGS